VKLWKLTLLLLGFILVSFCLSVYSGGSLCLSRTIIGLPCPGCGMTRALIAISHRDIIEALRLHPLSLMLVPFGGTLLLSPFSISARRFLEKRRLWQAVIAIFLVVYIIRMIMMFPSIEPMTLNEDAPLLRLFISN